jgi:hypothetical protein
VARGHGDRFAYSATFVAGAALGGAGLLLFVLYVRTGRGGRPRAGAGD